MNICEEAMKPEARPLADSGARTTYATGALRDTPPGKGMPHLVSPFAMRRLWVHLEKGALKYSPRNWEKGIVFSRFFDGIQRHLHQWWAGECDEDHLAAAFWGVMCLMDGEGRIGRQQWQAALDDRPDYTSKETQE